MNYTYVMIIIITAAVFTQGIVMVRPLRFPRIFQEIVSNEGYP